MRAKTSMLLTLVALILGSFLAIAAPATAAGQADKVTICHKPGTADEAEISVSRNALDAHLAHGDWEGSCVPPTPVPTPVPTPTPVACNTSVNSGGYLGQTTTHELGTTGPTSFQLYYEMYGIPDQIDVYYEGVLIYTSGGFVSGGGTFTVNVPAGTSTIVSVTVTAPDPGTAWDYIVYCPT